jgi:hypothetical protein
MRLAPSRSLRASLVVGLSLAAGRAQAQGAMPARSLVEQMRTLQAASLASKRMRLGAAKTAADEADARALSTGEGNKVLLFISDPLYQGHSASKHVESTAVLLSNWYASIPTADDIATLANAFGSASTSAPVASASQLAPLPPFVSGLSDFVVNRAEDEMAVSFLMGLRDRIASDSLLKHMFPQTLLVAAGIEARSAKQLLPALRSAMSSDLAG